MRAALPIAAGLAGGVAVAILFFVALVAFAPEPGSAGATPTATTGAGGSPSSLPTAAPTRDGPSPATSPTGGSASPGTANFHVGEPAPPLSIPQVGGGTIDLAVLRGKPVWINFMATWCPPCRDEFPAMNAFAVRYADDNLVVIAVDVREDEGTVAAFAESLGATFPLGLDSNGAAQQTWQAFVLPVHFWIDAQGIVRDGALGGIGRDVMAAGLQKILPGVTVTP